MQLLDQDLEKEVTKSIVILCGGNPDAFDALFGNKSP